VDIGQHIDDLQALIDDHMNQEMRMDEEEEQMVDTMVEKIISDRNVVENEMVVEMELIHA
jgi:hypothetical protein